MNDNKTPQTIEEENEALLEEIHPVSYTHLDVYKRQCYTLERTSPRYRGIIHMNVNEEEQGEK